MYLKYLQDTFPYLNIADVSSEFRIILFEYVSEIEDNEWIEIKIIKQDSTEDPYLSISSVIKGHKSLILSESFEAIDYNGGYGLTEDIEKVLHSIPFVKKHKRDYIINTLK